jgi:predicted amino acid-binding ACT domain protein
MSDVSDILAKAALDLRQINQNELADILTLLALLATPQQIAAARAAILTILQTP